MNKKILKPRQGGPPREAYGQDKIIPVNFNDVDLFHDLGAKLAELEREVAEGLIEDLIIITRKDAGDGLRQVGYYWRGKNTLTTILGMLDYVKCWMFEERND